MNKDLSRRLNTTVNTSIGVKQRVSMVKYVVAGTLIFGLFGIAAFLYLNLSTAEQAEARKPLEEMLALEIDKSTLGLLDLAHLTKEEMGLLQNRDFVTDTIQKEYSSVKWNLNNTLSHLTLEVSNNQHEYSLELFDRNGSRVLYFADLTSDKVFVDKLELVANHEYNYLVRNSVGEMYAGNLLFN